MRQRILQTLALAMLLLGMAAPARAVSQKEMEQARTITAFWYLRYANNGAGYMEEVKMPSSMPELEKMLKEKERANLKSFKAVSVPSDYASWDKDKLVAYWSGTFFNSPGLLDEGKVAKGRVKSKLNAMTVAAPAPAPAPEAKPEEAAPGADAATEGATPAEAPLAAAEAATAAEVTDQAKALDSTALATVDDAAESTRERKSSSGSTWIYIVALVVLVGVVVWLVIFASRTMQEGKDRKDEETPDTSDDPIPAPRASGAAAPVQAEPGEMRALRREIKTLRDECMRLGEENGRLQSDLNEARRELEALRGRLRAATAVTSAASAAGTHAEAPARMPAPVREEPAEEAAEPREIYLGRVNPKGLFVRADKRPVADKSVFVLTTTDGYTGSYRVLQMDEVIGRCLDNPDHYLAGGCTAPDIMATDDSTQIRTLQSGTAIFENGCWRMIRKSKIVYE